MKYVQLGETDLQVSSIGLGCVTFGREIDRSMAFEVLDRAWERGIRLFDTAAIYGQGASEEVLGQWIVDRGVRADAVLATKVSQPLTKGLILRSAEESLARLQTEQIDLFQVHVWDDSTPLEDTLEGLTALVESGKVRFVGCSNWQACHLADALRIHQFSGAVRMNSVQPPYNLVQRDIETDLLPLCAEHQVGVISYSPLAAGFLTGKYERGGPVPPGARFDVIPAHQPIYFTDHGYAVLEQLRKAAEAADCSMIGLAIGWVLTRRHVSSVLIGARHPRQVDQAFEAERLAAESDLSQFAPFGDAACSG